MRSFDDVARSSDLKRFTAGIGAWNAPSRLAIAARIKSLLCRSVLDIGCGPGVFMETLDRCDLSDVAYFGIDSSQTLVDHAAASMAEAAARVAPKVIDRRVRLFDPCNLSLMHTDFRSDAVVLRHVLEHVGPQHWRTALAFALQNAKRAVLVAFSQPTCLGEHERETDRYLGLQRWAIPAPVFSLHCANAGWSVVEVLDHPSSKEVVQREQLFVVRPQSCPSI